MTGGLTRRSLGLAAGGLLAAGLARPALAVTAPAARGGGRSPWPYLLGADISWVPEDEAAGATYYDAGLRRDPLAIFKGAGFNAIKLRLFVDPANGYSRGKPGGSWCGLADTIAFARRIKAAGLHLSLTLHYSDDWADPQKQTKPAAWAQLAFPRLVDAVHRYTRDALGAMAKAGAAPDLVVIGNETTFGMLWPEGRVPLTIPTGNAVTDQTHMNVAGAGGFDKFALLLKAGLAGAREAVPGARLAVHNHLGRHWPIVQHWMDALIEREVRFDATGFSCYQQAAQGDWARTFDAFEARYPGIAFFAIEYSSRKRYLNDLIHGHANGWGSVIWEPTRHQEAIFTRGGVNAGEGARPDLISQGANSAEAPGGVPGSAPAAPRPPEDHGGRYDADPHFIDLYRTMARDYGLAVPPAAHT
ncbi:glycosyl hydrolase 53 family protein [Novosphingobium resinovorum]|uniref:glycosyl hydrolase 53 family protein n=1 Tax=Novosphingobium resinovorum TaxID=158500 RepID=UPI002ED1DAEF|nr:glycosyl hydrolase 53 family protein [Novosphingobium resinovorum]